MKPNQEQSISGGQNNDATAGSSSISGGFANTASGQWASVSGGGGGGRTAPGLEDWAAGTLFEDD